MRILVVDDDDLALEMVCKALEDAGYETLQASDGAEAIKVLSREPIRIVISDWLMPGVDGLGLCRHIRNGAFPGYVYIILLTGRTGSAQVVQGLSAGADDFVAKPFDTAELLVRVKAGERIVSLETRHVAIFALAKLAESRDPETGQHLERIRKYSTILASELADNPDYAGQVTTEYVETIYLTSPLHDIGKVGIPDSVLLKPGRLSDAEFETMKRHTLIGGETLGAAESEYDGVPYLRMAREIAVSHHERWDGTGYPHRLEREQIPLAARIVALADVYDALVSKRVYKAAIPHDVARQLIIDDSGTHFDPAVVEAFLAREAEFIACHEHFADADAA
ncbi:MAG TPA: two-component system response regulator [Armatimonadetes bacterium]|nr:two-component system response regulator [Armatimonadota bacterium]